MLFSSRPRWVIHPVLLVWAYSLSDALTNEVPPAGYARALVIGAFLAICLTGVAWLLCRNRWDGALVATGIFVVAATPLPLAWAWYSLQSVVGVTLGTLILVTTLPPLLAAAAFRVLRALRRHEPIPRPAPATLNGFSLALLLVVVASNAGHLIPPAPTPVATPAGWTPPAKVGPDMIFILLDDYPRADVLGRLFSGDNTSFLDALVERGFDVPKSTFANYDETDLSLPSVFQMRYLQDVPSLTPLLGGSGRDTAALIHAAESGQALSILRAAGYELTFSSPGWEHVTYRGAADRLLDSGELTDLERDLPYRTWFLYLLDAFWPNVFTDAQHDRVVHEFDALDAFASDRADGPRFLFLHVPSPHPPVVIQADGSATRLAASRYGGTGSESFGLAPADYAAAFQSQLDYLDARVLQGVDAVFAGQRDQEPVIVVLSEEGFSFEVEPEDHQAMLGNLLAAYTPDAPGLLADAPTPVNLFRVLFNRYLGTQLPLLPDRYFLRGAAPLDLTEVDDPNRTPE